MRPYAVVVLPKTIPDSRPKWTKCILDYRPEKPIPIPFGAEHTYMIYIREYTPRGGPGSHFEVTENGANPSH